MRQSVAAERHGELLRDGVEGSMRHLAMLFAAELYDAWAGAATSLRGGEVAFSARFGMPFFDWIQGIPRWRGASISRCPARPRRG